MAISHIPISIHTIGIGEFLQNVWCALRLRMLRWVCIPIAALWTMFLCRHSIFLRLIWAYFHVFHAVWCGLEKLVCFLATSNRSSSSCCMGFLDFCFCFFRYRFRELTNPVYEVASNAGRKWIKSRISLYYMTCIGVLNDNVCAISSNLCESKTTNIKSKTKRKKCGKQANCIYYEIQENKIQYEISSSTKWHTIQ